MTSTTLPPRRRTIRTKADAERAVYADLRQIARRLRSRESPGITLATTGLVHEAYLSLQRSHGAGYEIGWNAEVSFGLYATAMRNVLVSAARRRRADKRGGGAATVPISEHDVRAGADPTGVEGWAHLTVDLDAAMERVRRASERLHRVVELKFFAGLEIAEIAGVTGTSPATVKRDWEKARALLYAYVSEDSTSQETIDAPQAG
ncbi:ECF-type sigma factor [Rubricoccus marinus]|uniref:RNA polymerase sigma-70 ECF-like HTH domain-containing protein n=1 Tax=Rubricoccus marinus TaxID=716817 RepID=A0A259TU24_9BACT|nr:ECF-type sigma factor [Rubricoccus marinus]OZC01221.1 hypothetical protein BSZ36_18380 [Rubricoccus marinus]